MSKAIRTIIMGAAGRDFHLKFNVAFRDDDRYEVVAFTPAQIPNIGGRVYRCTPSCWRSLDAPTPTRPDPLLPGFREALL